MVGIGNHITITIIFMVTNRIHNHNRNHNCIKSKCEQS